MPRHPWGERAMTAAERQARYRAARAIGTPVVRTAVWPSIVVALSIGTMQSLHSPPCKPSTPFGWRACPSTCRRAPPRRRSAISISASCRRPNRHAASAGIEHEMARTGTGSRTTREGGTARSIPLQRVDAGVKERNEMTIGRTDNPENPIRVTASRSRRTVWDWIADPIWVSGHAPRQ